MQCFDHNFFYRIFQLKTFAFEFCLFFFVVSSARSVLFWPSDFSAAVVVARFKVFSCVYFFYDVFMEREREEEKQSAGESDTK